jgi:protein subunit release factor A
MDAVLIELKAGEGGDDAKLLVEDQLGIYTKAATKNGL